ncbi:MULTISPECIES: hypothetical protein [Cytobacillus]|uniref:hypothetical protein n=1 Tax=Cytobacillus TaxID=2675230 RepID=UPI00203DC54E|nr:hypothetical protein [Cytobacillus firmus]MCM3708668.1 hypothetical protein [Cytobacillus firmus]
MLLAFLVTAIIDNLSVSNSADELKKENAALEKQILAVEELIEENTFVINENKELIEKNEHLNNEVEGLKEPIKYEDFMDSLNALEDFLSYVIKNRNDCPCYMYIGNHQYEWIHKPLAKPYAFRQEKGKIYLAYESPEYYDYEWVIGKYKEGNAPERWSVEDIKYIKNAN